MPGYEAQLKGILDGIAESIAEATDAEILEEATEIDKEKARRLKALMVGYVCGDMSLEPRYTDVGWIWCQLGLVWWVLWFFFVACGMALYSAAVHFVRWL